MRIVLQIIGFALYLGLGLFQLFAIMDGLEEWIGLHSIIAGPVALVLAYFPIVGTVVGMFGAVTAWGWSWLEAVSLFVGPLVLFVVIAIVAGGWAAIRDRFGSFFVRRS